MPEPPETSSPLSDVRVAQLLQTPSSAQQIAWLRGQGLFSEQTVQQLFQVAAEHMGSDWQKAGVLADLCAAASEEEGWVELGGQASYLRAQVHAIHAEFESALRLIEAARGKFLAAGNTLAALRTAVGWMNVMRELGRCREAIATGIAALQQIDALDAELGKQSLIAARMRNNLGICFDRQGEFDEALRYWAESEKVFRQNGADEEAGHVQNNRGVVFLKLGQAQQALAEFETAAHAFAEDDFALNLAQTHINLSHTHFMLGNPGQGLSSLEVARALIEPMGASADNLVLMLDTAEAYHGLNLQEEALRLYEQVIPAMQSAGMSDERLRGLLGMSSALMAQGRSAEAAALLNEGSDGATDAPAIPIRCRLRLNRASALSRTGHEADATQQAMLALHEASTHGWQRQRAEAHLLFAELPSTPSATVMAHLEQARQIAQQAEWPSLRTQVNQQLGRTYLRAGREADAEKLLLAAIDDVEQSRATLAEDQFRAAFLKNRADAFDDLVQLHLRRSQAAQQPVQKQAALQTAFAFAERAKSRALLDMMTNVALSGAGPQQAAPVATRPSTATRVTFHLDEVRAQLDARSVLLYYYICGDDISAFVISKHNDTLGCVHGLSQISKVAPLLDALAIQWERFLAGANFVARYAQQMEASVQRVLSQLHQALVAPVEALIREHARAEDVASRNIPLVILAHGALHQVPFHALHDGTAYLIERYEISYAPSATTFLLSQQRQAVGRGKVLVVGADDDSIPMALIEAERVVQQLRQTHPQAVLRVGAQATLQQVQADSAECDIVHLACHGLFRRGNPLFSSLQLHDAKLTAADAVQLKLNGALVTLGACESGRSEVIAGDEMLGLPRAFLGAGASSVLVSLWLVHDETTAAFMQGWYAQIQQGAHRAQALRAMQRAIKQQHPHPYYWAPFVLMGQR